MAALILSCSPSYWSLAGLLDVEYTNNGSPEEVEAAASPFAVPVTLEAATPLVSASFAAVVVDDLPFFDVEAPLPLDDDAVVDDLPLVWTDAMLTFD